MEKTPCTGRLGAHARRATRRTRPPVSDLPVRVRTQTGGTRDKSSGVYKRKTGRRTTPVVYGLKEKIRITHPFHPLYSKQYGLVGYRRSWGYECVDLHDDQEGLLTVPIAWTDAADPDPFVVVAAGRSYFRVEDLVRLVYLVDGLGV